MPTVLVPYIPCYFISYVSVVFSLLYLFILFTMNMAVDTTMDDSQSTTSNNSKTSLGMICGAFYIPKERVSKPQGDDAHFIFEEKQTIGVADGVGGWNQKGVDAGIYARELMSIAVHAIQNSSKEEINPKEVLNEAYLINNAEGSSTACILTLANNHLHAANVGDSGFLLIREGQIFFKSPIQQSCFNCPYQLGKLNGNPDLAQIFKIPVRAGDVIVVGTDGLFDNLFENDILEIVQMVTNTGGEPQQAAWAVAEHAYHNSIDKYAPTPYTQVALTAGIDRFGGKKDDITVIVSYVVGQ